MRNPFARLARHAAPGPSLRERATALRVSAARVITPPEASPEVDPQVAYRSELLTSHAERHRARPIENVSVLGTLEDIASGLVARRAAALIDEVLRLPPPRTLEGLAVHGLALALQCEGCAGDSEEDARDAATARAIFSVTGELLPEAWEGFGDEPGQYEKHVKYMETEPGVLPAWAIQEARAQMDQAAAPANAGPNPALAKMVAEWVEIRNRFDSGNAPEDDEEANPLHQRWVGLQYAIYRFPAATVADLQAKVPVYRDELGTLKNVGGAGASGLAVSAWNGVLADIEGLPGTNGFPQSNTDPVRAYDLSALTVLQLCNLYERHLQAADFWNDALHAPWANEPERSGLRDPNAAGDVVEIEQERAERLRDAVATEIAGRTPPADQFERDMRIAAMIRHEILCNGSLRHEPGLRRVIAEQWGA